jgi:MmyB-like transcription regulator ligand binding domain
MRARPAGSTRGANVGPDIDDPRLTTLVGELSLRSEEFRRLWARHVALLATTTVPEREPDRTLRD